MNDKDIRKILISYLQAQGKEMRIYQEKSIGASICDVMAVTDQLSGYEIKSDGDDLRRLDDQVRAYTAFFDENWLVVSNKHEGSAPDHVPAEWGIVCIDAGSVQVTRPAKPNRLVNRRRQLSILWKLELKNILTKNEMPLYAQRDKDFIADRIAETVEDGILQKQIAMELLHRDYSVAGGRAPAVDGRQPVNTRKIETNGPARTTEPFVLLCVHDINPYQESICNACCDRTGSPAPL